MIDINLIRTNPELLDAAMAKRGQGPVSAELTLIDVRRREFQTQQQTLQADINELSRQVGELKKSGQNANDLMNKVAAKKEQLGIVSEQETRLADTLKDKLSRIPNMPADDVPIGKDETENVELRSWGAQPSRLNDWQEHHKLGGDLGMMSAEIAARMSGTRFTWLERGIARLERAIGQFFLDTHTTEFGYNEVSPPLLVKAPAMYGTGQLPKFEEDLFKTTDGFYLLPTAEVSLTNRVADQIMTAEDLPMRMTALTPCFRSEAGSAGRDTVGMLRQHQFYKVELVSITTPDQSKAEHERMTEAAETVLKRLELPFRTMLLCAGDMGFGAQKTYDIEVWLPGQGKYREISSCSNCGDFQARRMNARFRAKGEKATQFLHTLNGSGTATGRALIAVMENYQQADGSIAVPAVLQKYMNGLTVIKKDN